MVFKFWVFLSLFRFHGLFRGFVVLTVFLRGTFRQVVAAIRKVVASHGNVVLTIQ